MIPAKLKELYYYLQSLTKGMTMLALRRKKHETVTIMTPRGEELKVAVIRIAGDAVSIGFDAPQEYRIYRTELLTRARKESK